jgi:hypothetical protein
MSKELRVEPEDTDVSGLGRGKEAKFGAWARLPSGTTPGFITPPKTLEFASSTALMTGGATGEEVESSSSIIILLICLIKSEGNSPFNGTAVQKTSSGIVKIISEKERKSKRIYLKLARDLKPQ